LFLKILMIRLKTKSLQIEDLQAFESFDSALCAPGGNRTNFVPQPQWLFLVLFKRMRHEWRDLFLLRSIIDQVARRGIEPLFPE
jgi:hypothetical protein